MEEKKKKIRKIKKKKWGKDKKYEESKEKIRKKIESIFYVMQFLIHSLVFMFGRVFE